MSLLTHRYLREYGADREEEIVDKAFRTLGLFCVGEEAKRSLEVRTPHSICMVTTVTNIIKCFRDSEYSSSVYLN